MSDHGEGGEYREKGNAITDEETPIQPQLRPGPAIMTQPPGTPKGIDFQNKIHAQKNHQ